MAKNSTRRRAQRRGRPHHISLVRVMVHLEKKDRPFFDFDIGYKEYAGIGWVMVQWAYLEAVLYERTAQLARRAHLKIPQNAREFSFSRRMRVLRSLVLRLRDKGQQKAWLRLYSEIGSANGRRQKLAHGLWSYDATKPDRLFSRSKFKAEKWLTPFNVPALAEFAMSVGQLSFALASLPPLPRQKEPDGFAPYMSRSFLLTMAGKDPEDLGLHSLLTTPPKEAPPQTPSGPWGQKLKELAASSGRPLPKE